VRATCEVYAFMNISESFSDGTISRTVALPSPVWILQVTDEQDRTPSAPDNSVVRRLVREANITEEQARELIALLGSDWPSLMREARFLTRKR
jgi:hypothetical protein